MANHARLIVIRVEDSHKREGTGIRLYSLMIKPFRTNRESRCQGRITQILTLFVSRPASQLTQCARHDSQNESSKCRAYTMCNCQSHTITPRQTKRQMNTKSKCLVNNKTKCQMNTPTREMFA